MVSEVDSDKKNIEKQKLDFFDVLGEVLGAIQIVFSPLLFAAIIGFLVYISKPGLTRLFIGIAITVVGLIVGIILAIKASKGKGTMHVVSRANASPELDHLDEDKKETSHG